ncbi:MAG TPA: ABC transporter ATP-binding protein [Bacillota bacterium]|nr:ABC transporter ATP-binding protein [Bacillota bacterium]
MKTEATEGTRRQGRINSGLREVWEGFKLLSKIDRSLGRNSIILGFLDAVVPLLAVYMGARVIQVLTSGGDIMKTVLLAITLNLVLTFLAKWVNVQFDYGRMEIWRKKDAAVSDKLMEVDFEVLEDPRTHEKLNWLRETEKFFDYGLPAEAYYAKNIVKGGFTLLIGAIMSARVFKVPLPGVTIPLFLQNTVFIALIAGINVWCVKLAQRGVSQLDELSQSEARSINLLFSAYWPYWGDYSYGKDTRLYTQKALKSGIAQVPELLGNVYAKFLGYSTSIGVKNAAAQIGTMGLVYGFVGVKAYYGLVTAADIILFAGTVTLMMTGLTDSMQNYSKALLNTSYIKVLDEFLNLKSERYQGTLPVEKRDDNEYEIEVKNVSFRYPGSDKYVLNDVNLKLRVGEKLAVVGMNGSGKTTLIKLITRFYDPTEGEITLNGIDIRKFDYQEYLDLFSVVFQDFKLLSFTIAENVAASTTYDDKKVEEALKLVGFEERLRNMPDGIRTYIYKDFAETGVEISGGEAQKIAMARALYKGAPFVILDEPTAALDPISEFDIYTRFDSIVQGRTAIYISHRLSSCRFCDDIVVFHEGRIVQRGNHDELIKDTEGKYYELWSAQAQYYKEQEIDVLL